jgi:DNA-binding NarL/FixJ family response regulator
VARRHNDITAIVIAADPLARAGLASVLERAGVAVAAQTGPRDLGAALGASGAQVVVWDVSGGPSMPEALGRETALPVVALVGDPPDPIALLGAGARAVVRRDAPPARLVAAIHAVQDGLLVVDVALAPALRLPRRGGDDVLLEPLTAREVEVLQLLSRGYANRRIGAALGISEHTAKFHVNAILAKLGARTRTDAVVRAARLGLVVL